MRVKKYFRQRLVRWEKSGTGGSGQTTYKAPVEVRCRWEDRSEEVQMLDGRRVISNAHIMAGSAFLAGDLVMKGTIADWKALPTYPKLPSKNQGGVEIFKAGDTPSIKGKALLFEAFA